MNFGLNANPFSPKAQHPSFNLNTVAPSQSILFDTTPCPYIPNNVDNPFSPATSFNSDDITSFDRQAFLQSPICNSNKYVGQLLTDHSGGNKGRCVSFVEKAYTGEQRPTSDWVEGPQVRGNTNLQAGTPIAVFRDGKYRGDHAAIYEKQDDEGIHVVDQWEERPNRSAQLVHRRIIRWNGQGNNNGNNYCVIK